jgi:hypothetical protein
MDGAEILTKLYEELGKKGIEVVLARVPDSQVDLLTRSGTVAAIGRENLYETVRDAVSAVQAVPPPVSSPEAS